MDESPIKQQIEFLRKRINEHNYEYYVVSKPTISDYAYDMLMDELIALEKKHPVFFNANSPTQRIGSDINIGFEQKAHKYPMLSLGNTYSETEVEEFHQRTIKLLDHPPQYVCELKYDGVSISLKYKHGELQQALTRGDGQKGDDVTANIRTIRSIPLRLIGSKYPSEFEIRGEIFMPFHVFEMINKERLQQGKSPFANPRNSASGTLKLKNSSLVAKRKLDCYLYYLISDKLPEFTHYGNMQLAASWGFKVSPHSQLCENLNEVFAYIKYWDIKRKKLNVATDGIVIKVNPISQQEILGFTAKSPRWAIAFKYKAEQAETKLINMSYQVGRTGTVTPVANLEKVLLSGTMVKRASLHNEEIINKLDLHINDTVFIEKGGEIIPKVIGVDKTRRNPNAKKVRFIQHCPDCHTLLVRNEDEAKHYCPNEDGCPTQIKGRIEHFIQRRAMDIDGLGRETIDLLFTHQLIRNIADLYTLKEENLISLERLGEKSANRILDSLAASKKVPFERVLYGIGIRYVGETVAKKLAYALFSIDEIIQADFEKLTAIDEIGEKIAESIILFFKSEKNRILIEELRMYGIQLSLDTEKLKGKNDILKGLRIIISGTFKDYSRNELKKLIEQNGGKSLVSVSQSTDYLLAGDNIGPAKLSKAKRLNIPIIDINNFMKMLE